MNSQPPLQYLRHSGRTTRMLEAAINLASEGRAVYVMTASSQEKRRLEDFLDRILKESVRLRESVGPAGGRLGIQFETTESTGQGFDWEQMRLVGAHPNCAVLVDHYAIEKRYARILEMLHRFDS